MSVPVARYPYPSGAGGSVSETSTNSWGHAHCYTPPHSYTQSLLLQTEMIRRASYTPSTSMAGTSQEPLIVVEETGGLEEEEEDEESAEAQTPRSGCDSPHLNPFLLSPYRDMRKRSLPTPLCTTGITASQVRRLSEQGGADGKGPSTMEAAFLATLSQAPAPQAGGRRHSVVTISRAPPTSLIFGRNRRESIAAFPGRMSRRDSSSSMTGSSFNLQLDIMDDIAEVKARKVRLKLWQNENQDNICEVQPLEGGPSSRYQQNQGASRRFSDVTGLSAIPPPIPPRRRASEMPQPRRVPSPPPSTSGRGIVCSNTDLISIMSSLTSSAQEIHNLCKFEGAKPSPLELKRSRLKGSRSNSFDISLLPDGKTLVNTDKDMNEASNWFIRRHQPMANKSCLSKEDEKKARAVVTFADEKLKTTLAEKKVDETKPTKVEQKPSRAKVVWDKPTGSIIDPKVIGSAIEVYLNQKGSEAGTPTLVREEPTPPTPSKTTKTSWFGSSSKNKQPDEEGASASCDTSICSTLKDLFVK